MFSFLVVLIVTAAIAGGIYLQENGDKERGDLALRIGGALGCVFLWLWLIF